MRTKVSLFLSGILFCAVPRSSAQLPVTSGVEFRVNTYTTNQQSGPAIASDPAGGFIVVWESEGSNYGDTSSFSVQGQRFTADATPIGSQFQVNSYITGPQESPAIATGPQGDFVVVWTSTGSPGDDNSTYSIQGQRFAADSSPLGSQFQVNTYTTLQQDHPAVAVASTGDFVVVWSSRGSQGNDTSYVSVQGQLFDADASPLGPQFQINSFTTFYQSVPAIAMQSGGDFVVVWGSACCSDVSPFSWAIQGQRYAADASPLGSQFQITSSYTTATQWSPAVATDSLGNFVVTWMSQGSPGDDSSSNSIQGKRFASDASSLGSQFQVNTYTTSGQDQAAVAMAPAGDFVVVWRSYGSSGDDTSSFSVQGQRFASDASPVSAPFQVNSYTSDRQQSPALILSPTDDFVVVWRSAGSANGDTSSSSIQGKRYQASIFADGFEAGDTSAWSAEVGADRRFEL